MRRLILIAGLVVLSVAACGGVWAAVNMADKPCVLAADDAASLAPVEEHPLAEGRIVALDDKKGDVTVAHEPIVQFYLDRETRIFPVEDRAALLGHSAGDKIRFELARLQGHYVITRLENSN